MTPTLLIAIAAMILASSLCSTVIIRRDRRIQEERLKARYRESDNEKMRFYTNIAHELRTPLTLIMGPLEELMKTDTLDTGERLKAELALKNSHKMLSLINSLLDFRKAESNNWNFRVSYGDLSRELHEIGDNFINTLSDPGVRMLLDIEDGIKVYYDRKIIEVILNNLLSNALKHTKKGSITLYCRRVEANRSIWVEAGVRDSGEGIPKRNPACLRTVLAGRIRLERCRHRNRPQHGQDSGRPARDDAERRKYPRQGVLLFFQTSGRLYLSERRTY